MKGIILSVTNYVRHLQQMWRFMGKQVQSKISTFYHSLKKWFFLNDYCWEVYFWTYRGGPINSPLSVRSFVRSFVRLLPAFLEIGSLVFSDFWHKDAKWQCPKCDGARFLKKNLIRHIWAQICPKIGFFGLFSKLNHRIYADFSHKDRRL